MGKDGSLQAFDIILFALIAVFLALRLRSVLGRRDGHEGGFPDLFKRDRRDEDETADRDEAPDNVIPLPGRTATRPAAEEETALSPALRAGLAAIREADPDFDPAEMTAGARIAFEMVLNAFATGDLDTLKGLLSPDVYGDFSRSIHDRQAAGQTMDATLVSLREAEIADLAMDGRMAQVTVRFVSEQITVTRDADGHIVDGDPNLVEQVTDLWTFARDTRSRDPNWLLVATHSPE
jgi:predicted lipid-binding transport protein (Tim44 family)